MTTGDLEDLRLELWATDGHCNVVPFPLRVEGPRVFGLVVGVNRPIAAGNLKYAENDALAVTDFIRRIFELRSAQMAALTGDVKLPPADVFTLTGKAATLGRIRSVQDSIFKRRPNPADTVLFFFSGHGVRKTTLAANGQTTASGYLFQQDGDPDLQSSLIPILGDGGLIPWLRSLNAGRIVPLLEHRPRRSASSGDHALAPRANARIIGTAKATELATHIRTNDAAPTPVRGPKGLRSPVHSRSACRSAAR
jgi:hypothetical protein